MPAQAAAVQEQGSLSVDTLHHPMDTHPPQACTDVRMVQDGWVVRVASATS